MAAIAPELELGIFPVTDLRFGDATALNGRTLLIGAEALRQELQGDPRVKDCQFALMRPGEAVRAVHVIDVCEPRIKVESGDYFGGVIGSLATIGRGRTHVLRGAAVVLSCTLPGSEEGIIDMTGIAAPLSKFGSTCNLVVMPELQPGLAAPEATQAAFQCAFRAAVHLARASLGQPPDTVERYQWPEPAPGLPRVAYICYLYSHGPGRERHLYGKTSRDILPTVVPPNDILDGAVVQYGHTTPSKNVTFNHQNNGMLRALYPLHNQQLAVAGVIMINHNLTFADKQRSAALAAHLARNGLHCDGVVVTKEGGGQGDVDVAEVCDRCEELGLKTVLVVKEEGGETGAGYPLVVVSRRADAIVTTGNGVQLVHIHNQVDRVIGGESLYDGTPAGADHLHLAYNYIVGSVDFEGDVRITSREF